MNRHDVNWTGYIPAVTTPFTRDGDLDFPSLAVMMEWYVEQRMHGVVLAGTSGEWFSLSEGERAELFLEAGRTIDKRITVLGGAMRTPRKRRSFMPRLRRALAWTASS